MTLGTRPSTTWRRRGAMLWAALALAAAGAQAQESTATDLNCSPDPSAFGQTVTCDVLVSAAIGTPTGTVIFKIDGGPDNVVALNGSAQAFFLTSTLSVGDHLITADYVPDTTDFESSSDFLTQSVIDPATTTVVTCTPNPSVVTQLITCTATVTAVSGATPTGTVTFGIDGGPVGVVALNAAGQASFSTNALLLGPHTISADYTSNAPLFENSGDSHAQSVVSFLTTTGLDCQPNPAVLGQLVTCTAAVAGVGGGGTPTGTVTFRIDGASPVVVALASGQASFSTSALVQGEHEVTADYTSDSTTFGDSAAAPVLLQIVLTLAEIPALGAGGAMAFGLLLLAGGLLVLGGRRRAAPS